MKSKRHGVALIINNKQFKAHSTRTGTDRDEYNLIETWLFLGYHVVVIRDCTKDELVRTFNEIDKLLESVKDVTHDSFVCCILSHGVEGEVIGSDSKPLKYTAIMKYLAKSDTLRSQPKMLFIQACQGESDGSVPLEDRLKSDDGQISEYTDFYLSCASVEGDKSYRDIYNGIYVYVWTLCIIVDCCCYGNEIFLTMVLTLVIIKPNLRLTADFIKILEVSEFPIGCIVVG